MNRKAKPPAVENFESALAELEKIVRRMEEQEQPLEDSLRDFQRGMELSQQCHQHLKKAEQKVQMLMEKHGLTEAVPFDPDREQDRE